MFLILLACATTDSAGREPVGDAWCETRTCDGWVDPPHETYTLCTACDAATDTCQLTFTGEDGADWYSCTWSPDDTCEGFYEVEPSYCSKDGSE